MNMQIVPHPLHGSIAAIPSKSAAHRLLICAALADQPTKLLLSGGSADIYATISCLRSLGAQIEQQADGLYIHPIQQPSKNPLLDCRESGSTLRFLLPVAAVLCTEASFQGCGRLPQRPLTHLRTALQQHGVEFSAPQLPFEVSGQLSGGSYQLPGNVSSQYISGLLFALPLLQENSFIHLSTTLESAAYIDMTLAALKQFGVQIHKQPQGYAIPGRQCFHSPGEIQVEGDWSNAAFFLAAGAIGQSCTVSGLDLQSPQGDREIVQLLRRFGAQVQVEKDRVSVSPAPLHGCTIDISQVPDLLPILAVTAACATGESRFIHAARLRLKESDRLTATAALLHALGIHSSESPDSLIVRGGALLGGTVDSYHDHRIAMAAAIAATRCRAPVTILDAAAVEKSYPGFFTDYIQLGGQAYGI